ncbi:hypothetical protein [Paenibacillus sp. CAA11]|uniref:hypothetical protein n=1 Tax=Paenibacillus sp. CAA11 TaxID=1532905 RepID=UPI00131F21CA|nr:hypothetical protein [Paenibacillus sp. CAA11]
MNDAPVLLVMLELSQKYWLHDPFIQAAFGPRSVRKAEQGISPYASVFMICEPKAQILREPRTVMIQPHRKRQHPQFIDPLTFHNLFYLRLT